MNQSEFMGLLRQELARSGQSDIDDILSDFAEHFATGLANGKDEETIARDLGDPAAIAAQYANRSGSQANGRAQAGYRWGGWSDRDRTDSTQGHVPGSGAAGQSSPGSVYVTRPNNRGWMVALLLIVNIFIVLPVFVTTVLVMIVLWAAAGGVGVAAGSLFVLAFARAGFISIVFVLFGLSLTALTILLCIGMYFLTKLFLLAVRQYIQWNKQLVSGGEAA